jgi:hypothetical protein
LGAGRHPVSPPSASAEQEIPAKTNAQMKRFGPEANIGKTRSLFKQWNGKKLETDLGA